MKREAIAKAVVEMTPSEEDRPRTKAVIVSTDKSIP